jgi:serine/threonine protein kinase
VHQAGAGVLGPVFRGYDPETDRAVAIKSFPLDITPEQAAALAGEFTRLAGLNLSHPSIVAPLFAGADGATTYVVMDYFVADSLDVALKQYGPAPVPDALRLVGQLAGALDFAAAVGVHHGALHPRDVLVAPHDVRLTGLGIAAAVEGVGQRVPARRPYAAPERLEAGTWGAPADVFSLACLTLELLTGRRPSGQGAAGAADLGDIQAANPAALTEVFVRATSPRVDLRYQSALAFAAALKHALTGDPLASAEPERPRGRRAPKGSAGDRVGPRLPLDRDQPTSPVPFAPPDASGPADSVPPPVPVDVPRVAPVADEPAVGGPLAVSPDGVPPLAPAGSPVATGQDTPSPVAGLEPAPKMAPEGHTPLPVFLEVYRPPAAEAGPGADGADASTPAAPHEARSAGDADLDAATVSDGAERPTTGLPLVDDAGEPAPALIADLPLEPVVSDGDGDLHLEPRPAAPAAPDGEALSTPGAVSRAKAGWRLPVGISLGVLLVGLLAAFAAGYLVGVQRGRAPSVPRAAAVPAPVERAAAPAVGAGGAQASAPPPTTIEASATRPAAPQAGGAESPAPPKARAARATTLPPKAAQQRSAVQQKTAPGTTFRGTLVVESRPTGATVLLDGREVGTTPLTLPSVNAGSHAVKVELAGYSNWSSAVQVTTGQRNRVTASLERLPGG